MDFSPGLEFYSATSQVIPLLLLALLFEVRILSRLAAALRTRDETALTSLREELAELTSRRPDGYLTPHEEWRRARLEAAIRTAEAPEGAPIRRRHRALELSLMIGLAMALVAEAIALIALALDDPPEPFAYAVLAGTAALLIALGFAVADFISYEVRLKPAAPAGRSRK